ncbi:hypothetical protein A2W24_06425 [Microgenomates group bacterium RBG_16_45_19]|nr:MAG: hypothetical protein A2W24_06425 [Microgenomates group bacterium RBG_16_45_19]
MNEGYYPYFREEMKIMWSILIGALFLLVVPPAFAAEQTGQPATDSLQAAYVETISTARKAVNKYGITDSAMTQIQAALAKLAAKPSLKERAQYQHLHGSAGANAAMLTSEGEDGISLFIVRFDSGQATPVHDHLTWGVVHVLEGRDLYMHWEPRYSGKDSSQVELRIARESILEPGSSVYWFGPPHDLHSQEAKGATVWELVLAGRNLLSPLVLEHRHYYDPKTGRVTKTPPK